MRGAFAPPVYVLWFALTVWIAGFDRLATPARTSSSTARTGCTRSLRASAFPALLPPRELCHVLTIAAFARSGWTMGLGWLYWVGVAAVAGLLVYEHSLVSPGDLSRSASRSSTSTATSRDPVGRHARRPPDDGLTKSQLELPSRTHKKIGPDLYIRPDPRLFATCWLEGARDVGRRRCRRSRQRPPRTAAASSIAGPVDPKPLVVSALRSPPVPVLGSRGAAAVRACGRAAGRAAATRGAGRAAGRRPPGVPQPLAVPARG